MDFKFEKGIEKAETYLESALRHINSWYFTLKRPKFIPNTITTLHLPFNLKLVVEHSSSKSAIQLYKNSKLDFKITSDSVVHYTMSSVFSQDINKTIIDLIPDIYKIYELTLIGEPIIVYSSTPEKSSKVVLELLDLTKQVFYL